MIYKWIFFSSFFVHVWTHITLPTHETIPTFYRLRRNETADRTTALDRSHSKLNSWLGLSGANDSSDVKLVHFLLFVAMDSWNENIVYARRKIRFLVFEKNRELNARKLEFVETGNVRMRLRVSSSAISRQMSVYRGKTMNRGVRTCVRANAWPGVGISQTRMWILFAHPYDKVRSSYCFPSAKWYLKPFAKTSPTGLSPYRRDYIGYVRTRQCLCFLFFFRRLYHLPGWRENKHRVARGMRSLHERNEITLFMKSRNHWESM